MRDVKNSDNNATALPKHAVELGHSIDWKSYENLQIETDYYKRKFIELFYINSLFNVLNEKKSVCFPFIFQKEVVEWSARLARKRAFRVRRQLAPSSMMHVLL